MRTTNVLLQNDHKGTALVQMSPRAQGCRVRRACLRVSMVIDMLSLDAPHQRRAALEKILIKFGVTRTLGDGAQGDRALEGC
jgi:hypothetical protein